VQEPPKVWFCEDTDGDLRSDKRTEVGRLGVTGNPQHTANGLRYGIDNWLHSADSPTRHRWVDGKLVEEPTVHHGQFGVSFDETGRFITCHESSALHMDLIPAEYLVRNRHLAQVASRAGRGAMGVSVNVATEAQQVFPIRVTPGITLGALELRDDGRLRTYTIASGTCYYDGDQFPEDARGNVFVPEAGGHLIGRLKLTSGIRPKAARFYPPEQEFLASTDERFRPVNARVGPDGALYIADLYHGIIEHVIFMVPWISDQVRERQLDIGMNRGRLYRVVAEDRPIGRPAPKLSRAATAELVGHLSDATGWWRLTAQRLLVERADPGATPLLTELARHGTKPLGRLHALWTLDGLGRADTETKFAAMGDPDERVRAAAIRLGERGLTAAQQDELRARLSRVMDDPSESVKLQATLTAGTLPGRDALALVAELARRSDDPLFRIAALTGLEGRELDFLDVVLASSRTRPNEIERQRALIGLAAQCILESGDSSAAAQFLERLNATVSGVSWQRDALLEALVAVSAPGRRRAKPIALAGEPAALIALARGKDAALRPIAYRALELFTWPGATVALTSDAAKPLTEAEQKRLDAGRETYALVCAACHQPHGGGLANLAPPLAGSEWVTGSPERLARIILHGLYGPVQVNGQTWNLSMPGLGAGGVLDDEKTANVLSYIRRAWGNDAPLVAPAMIARVRRETAARTLPWTEAELQTITGGQSAPRSKVIAALKPESSGEIRLPARHASVYGQRLGYRAALDVLAPWTIAEDIAEWRVEVAAAGSYTVYVNLAADESSAGDFFVVETEGSRARGEVPSTGDYATFREQIAGELTLRAGVNRILLRPDGPLKRELADVRGVRLVPVAVP
jgi:mono/diheme cytochrome c family protein